MSRRSAMKDVLTALAVSPEKMRKIDREFLKGSTDALARALNSGTRPTVEELLYLWYLTNQEQRGTELGARIHAIRLKISICGASALVGKEGAETRGDGEQKLYHEEKLALLSGVDGSIGILIKVCHLPYYASLDSIGSSAKSPAAGSSPPSS